LEKNPQQQIELCVESQLSAALTVQAVGYR